MGADMLIESIGFRASSRLLIDEEWAAVAFASARHRIAMIDESRLAEVNRDGCNCYDDVASYQEELTQDLAKLELAVAGSHRQAAMADGGNGIILLITGGLSWGDSPGELFDSMSRLVACGVFPDARNPSAHQ